MTMLKTCHQKLFVSLSIMFLLAVPLIAAADLITDVNRDFFSVSGYLVREKGGEYLTDIGAKKGAMTGDLLGVVSEGEPLVHPVTGETLGSMNELIAVLRISKVKSEFSYALLVSGSSDLDPGLPVKRFAGLAAVFVDHMGGGAELYTSLSRSLDGLDWQGYFRPVPEQTTLTLPNADLLFFLKNGLLDVKDAQGQTVRVYPVEDSVVPVPAAPLVQSLAPSKAVSPVSEASPVKWEKQQNSSSGVDYEIAFPGYQQLALLNSKVTIADLFKQEEDLLIATTDGLQINVYQQSSNLQLLSTFKPPGLESIHALNWWQPDAGGSLYLCVSGSKTKASFSTTEELELSGYLLELRANRLVAIVDRVNFLFGSFDRDGNGRKETLIGQQLDLERFFGAIKDLQWEGGKLTNRKPVQKYPPRFSALGSVQADLTGDGELETAFVRDGILRIYKDDRLLYQLGSNLGGSLSQLTYDTNPGQVDALFTTVNFEIAPVAADIDRDGRRELIVVSSEKPGFFSSLEGESLKSSQLSVIKFTDGGFRRGSLGGELKAPVQGLFADGDRVVVVVFDSEAAGENKSNSRLLSIPLENGGN